MSTPQMISAQMYEPTVRKLCEVQDWLQTQRPDTRVSRSDAIRWCIEVGRHSLTSSMSQAGVSELTLESVEKDKLSVVEPVSRRDEGHGSE